MDIIFKVWESWAKQTSETTKNVIDANAAIAKSMVEYSQKPYTWLKETIKK